MTLKDFKKIRFRMCEHLSMEGQHCSIYESIDFMPKIVISTTTEINDDYSIGKTFKTYFLGDKQYESTRELIRALNKLEKERNKSFKSTENG